MEDNNGKIDGRRKSILRSNDAGPSKPTVMRRNPFCEYFGQEYGKFVQEHKDIPKNQIRKEMGLVWRQLPDKVKARYGKASKVMCKRGTLKRHVEPDRDIQCRCSNEKVCMVVSKMCKDQKMAIKNAGFGSFLSMKVLPVKSKLIGYLIDNFDESSKRLKINGIEYSINSVVFQKVMGIGDGGENITLEKDEKYNPILCALLEENSRLSVDKLVAKIVDTKVADEMFIIRFVLLAIGTILCPTSATFVNQIFVPVVSDIRRLSKKNWASLCVGFLVDSIRRFKLRSTKYMPACTIFLELFYLDKVDWAGGHVDRSIAPIVFWGEGNAKRVLRWVRSSGGFEGKKVRMIGQEKDEHNAPQYRDISVGGHCCNCEMRGGLLNMGDQVDKLRGEIMAKIDDFPNVVSQIVAREMLVIKRAIIEDLWKVAASKGSTLPNSDNLDERAEDHELSEGEKSCDEEDDDVVGDESFDLGVESDDDHIEALLRDGSTSTKDKEVLHSTKDEKASLSSVYVVDVSDKDDSPIKKKREYEDDTNTDALLVEVEKSNKKFKSSQGRQIGPFTLRNLVSIDDFKLALFLFSDNLPPSYLVASYGKVDLDRKDLHCLKPGREVDGRVITCYAQILSMEERARSRSGSPLYWFLPVGVSAKQLGKGMTVSRMAREQNWADDHFGDLKVVEHIVVPCHSKVRHDHWFLADIFVKQNVVHILDSMSTASTRATREACVKEMLKSLDDLLALNINLAFEGKFQFSSFEIEHFAGLPQQDGGSDCGIYMMKFMQSLRQRSIDNLKFYVDDARLEFALQIVRHERNPQRIIVLQDMEQVYMEHINKPSQASDQVPNNAPHITIRSPSMSPRNPKFDTKKQKSKNMIPSYPANRTRQALRRALDRE